MKNIRIMVGIGLAALAGSVLADTAQVLAVGNDGGKYKSQIVGSAEADGTSFYLLNREGISSDYELVTQKGDEKPKVVWGDSVAFVPEAGSYLKGQLPADAYRELLSQWAEWMVKTEGADSIRSEVRKSETAVSLGKSDDAYYTGDTLAALKAQTSE